MAVGASNVQLDNAEILLTVSDQTRFDWRKLELYIPATIFLALVVACFLGPVVIHMPSPVTGNLLHSNLPPLSPGHVLGTNSLGIDILSQSLYAGHVSIEVGFASVAIGVVIGGTIGIAAGYLGGWVDSVVMRCLDVLLAFPALILAVAIAAYLGPNERDVILAIAFFTVPAMARLSRSSTLRLREQGYVLGTKLVGGRDFKIVTRHVLPNVAPTLMTFGILGIGIAMLIEASLSFLGLGVPPPTPTWGNMISIASQQLALYPYQTFIPSAFLLVAVLSVNLVGDALRARRASA